MHRQSHKGAALRCRVKQFIQSSFHLIAFAVVAGGSLVLFE